MIRVSRTFAASALILSLAGCSTVYPLKSVAYRAGDPRALEQDVTVDISTTDLQGLKKLSWAAYSVTIECPADCPLTMSAREQLAREIADVSFVAVDRELRRELKRAVGQGLDLADSKEMAARPEFLREVKTDSFKKTVSRWFTRLGLAPAPEVTAAAGGLKSINPSELGWSGAQSLAAFGQAIGMDGVLVGHLRVMVSTDKDEAGRLVVQGPKLWLYSAANGAAAAVAGLRPSWRLDPAVPADPEAASAVAKLDVARELKSDAKLDWRGFDAIASGMSMRVAHALSE